VRDRRRIAVIGLYNSGSTAITRMLHRLGVNMGEPFWANSIEGDKQNFYEPYDLSWRLRKWWHEPDAAESVPSVERVRFLERWVALHECESQGPVGAKHPLLSFCGRDLVKAWGENTIFLWAWRPLNESIEKLKLRGWFPGNHESIQRRLWSSIMNFIASHPGVAKIEFSQARSDPRGTAQSLASLAGLHPSESTLRSATECIFPSTGTPQ
jgi:hypothetical protein